MSSVCANLTSETVSLVANGKSLDQLLAFTTSVENNKNLFNSNLTAFNSTLTGTALRSNQYRNELYTVNLNVDSLRAVPFVLLGVNLFIFIVYTVFSCVNMCKLRKYVNTIENQDQESEPLKKSNKGNRLQLIGENISISGASQMSPSQANIKKMAKLQQMSRKGLFPSSTVNHIITFVLLVSTCLVGLSSIIYTGSFNTAKSYCDNFKNAISGSPLASLDQLSTTQRELLTPIQKCMITSLSSPFLGATNPKYFLQTPDTPTYLNNIKQLSKVSQIYNSTTPTNVLNSISLQQIEILKNYLLHMDKMPIKSPDFTIQQVLSQLNLYTNGTAVNSRQITQSGNSVLKDQYVYNVADCEYNLINYLTEATLTEARCLQIPTWEGSGGSRDADLNNAQHTIELNATCATIYDFFNGTNLGCFLGKRLEVLRNSNCSSTAIQYNRRLKNLIKFSVESASYTNSYLQNLRNYFGVYFVLSTNLTQFFNGANTSAILNEFGSISNNIVNKTSCSYIQSAVNNVYDSYCPSSNSISLLLNDCNMLILIAFGMLSLSWAITVMISIALNAYGKGVMIDLPKYKVEAKQKSKQKQIKYNPKKTKFTQKQKASIKNQLEISQQTLNNEQVQQTKPNKLKHLSIIDHNIDEELQDNIEYLQVREANRNHMDKKDPNQSSQGSEDGNTQQNKADYDEEIVGQHTGKKLLQNKKISVTENVFQPKQEIFQNQQFNKNMGTIGTLQQTGKRSQVSKKYQTGKMEMEFKKKKLPNRILKFESDSSQRDDKPIFFGNLNQLPIQKYEIDSRNDDFPDKSTDKKNRKVHSKAEVRNYTREQKAPRSISRLTKQGQQAQRIRNIELQMVLKRSIDALIKKQQNIFEGQSK